MSIHPLPIEWDLRFLGYCHYVDLYFGVFRVFSL